MAEQKIVLELTEQQLFDLDAMATEGFRLLRDDATEQQKAAALAIVRRIDDNRRALLDGKAAPDAAPTGPTRMDLLCRIDDALSWIPSECAWCNHEPDRHGEKELAKLRGPLSHSLSGLLADPAQTTELERRLDETQQKLAEADRLYADLLAQREQWWEHVGRERAQLEAERDERQTRIEAAFRTCDAAELIAKIGSMEDPNRWKVALATVTDVRAALNGELPARAAPAGDQPKAEPPPGIKYPAGHIVFEHGEPAPGEPWPDCRHGRPQDQCTECPGLKPPLSGEDLRDAEERDDASEETQ